MIIQAVRIHRFKSFLEEKELVFPTAAGLYFLTGRNDSEPELGANGAGKSSLWDAICWGLYGKTSRGLRAGDVASWAAPENCWVEIDLHTRLGDRTLRRTWSPNALKIGPAITLPDADAQRSPTRNNQLLADVSQEALEAELGLGLEAFLNSVYLSQFGPMFLDLGPTEKANLLSAVLQLDRWQDASAEASLRTSKAAERLTDAKSEFDRKSGRAEELAKIDFTEDINAWNRDRAKAQRRLEEAVYDTQQDIKGAQKAVVERDVLLSALAKQRKEVAVILADAQAAVANQRNLRDARKGELTRITTHRDAAMGAREHFTTEGQCSSCLQMIAVDHRQDQVRRLSELIDSYQADLTRVRAEVAEIDRALHEAEEDLEVCRAALSEVNSKIVAAETSQRNILSVIKSLTVTEKQQAAELKAAAVDENPFEARQREHLVAVTELHQQLEITERLVSALQAEHRRCAYWVRGFKDLRLFLIAEALAQLEVEVNGVLMELGLVEWKIQFAMEAETKSGTIKKGFTATILSPHNSAPVAWEAWSGGEAQRLRIAVTMGLSNLILNTAGVRTNVEIWDEPSRSMSELGVQDLLGTLYDRAHRLNRQVWVVDHTALEFGGFERTVTVVNDAEGSRFDG